VPSIESLPLSDSNVVRRRDRRDPETNEGHPLKRAAFFVIEV
jgi:hypothetical protein